MEVLKLNQHLAEPERNWRITSESANRDSFVRLGTFSE